MNKMTEDIGINPQALAEATAKAMYARDRASQGLGMKVLEVAPGFARMTMTVREDMLNGHNTCHGGFIFTLADSAFAFACNSRNQNTVASGCSIDYIAPGFEGDVLFAEAIEQSRSGRTGVYDIDVVNQDGKRIALFRGKSYQIKGEIIPAPAAASDEPKLPAR
jgi:acyl-CoA thioesterase